MTLAEALAAIDNSDLPDDVKDTAAAALIESVLYPERMHAPSQLLDINKEK